MRIEEQEKRRDRSERSGPVSVDGKGERSENQGSLRGE
jgi:hypothetical protein